MGYLLLIRPLIFLCAVFLYENLICKKEELAKYPCTNDLPLIKGSVL